MKRIVAVLLITSSCAFAQAACSQATTTLSTLKNAWDHADGSLWFDASDSFLFVADTCPKEFIAFMTRNKGLFEGWRQELSRFSGFCADHQQLIEKKTLARHLHGAVQHVKVDGPQAATRDELLTTIEGFCVREVDVEGKACYPFNGDVKKPRK